MNPNLERINLLAISKTIAEVYFSKLRFKLKNDCVCRLIAHAFQDATQVSILLYDSKDDVLANFGHYINLSECDIEWPKTSNKYEFLLQNISIFEYLAYKFESNSFYSVSYEEYITCEYFKPISFENGNLAEVFKKIKDSFTISYYPLYHKYKSTLAKYDFYKLGINAPPSGVYFDSLVKKTVLAEYRDHKFVDSQTIPKKDKKLLLVLEEHFGIKITSKSLYLAIPLIAHGRYIGLIRVTWHARELAYEENNFTIKMEAIQKFLADHKEGQLKEFAALIALHIGNSYASHKFKQIWYTALQTSFNYAAISSNHNDSESFTKKNKLGSLCEAIRKSINCRACIIRIGIEESPFPRIVGWTEDIQGIENYIKGRFSNDHFTKNIINLEYFFTSDKHLSLIETGGTLIGLQFKINSQKIHNVKMLSLTEKGILNTRNAKDFLLEQRLDMLHAIFDPEVCKKLEDLSLAEVVILKIPHVKNGYITLANTANRDFSEYDINIIIPYINYLGSELHIIQQKEIEKRNRELKNRAEALEKIQHDIESPIGMITDKIEEINRVIQGLVDSDFHPHEIEKVKKIIKNSRTTYSKQVLDVLRYTNARLSEYKLLTSLEKKELVNEKHEPYSLKEFINGQIDIFREWTFYKLKIGIIKPLFQESILIDHSPLLISGIFWNLMHNAVKYSFGARHQKLSTPGFDENYMKKTEGHIKVECFDNDAEYGFSITNWGKRIPIEYVEKIFLPKFRIERNSNYLFHEQFDEISGDGMGLSNAKQYADLTDASITVKPEGIKTKMIVSWKIKQNFC